MVANPALGGDGLGKDPPPPEGPVIKKQLVRTPIAVYLRIGLLPSPTITLFDNTLMLSSRLKAFLAYLNCVLRRISN